MEIKTLEDAERSATPILTDPHKQSVLRLRRDCLFACESAARTELTDKLDDLPSEAAAKCKRIDMVSILRSAKTQPGIPFPVPRFAAFHVNEQDLRLSAQSGLGNNEVYPRGLKEGYAPFLESLQQEADSQLLRAKLFLRTLFLIPAALIGGAYLLGVWEAVHPYWLVAASVVAGLFVVAFLFSFAAVEGEIWSRRSVSLAAVMGNFIPDDIRKIISSALTSRTFEDIYILAEAPSWELSSEKLPAVKEDPLVIGRKGKHFYLLAKFDLSPLEKWIDAEFVTGIPPVEPQRGRLPIHDEF